MPTLSSVSTLGDLVHERTGLDVGAVSLLHRLVGEWQLIADLSFSDLLLSVRTREGTWLVVAHMRPTTGPTRYPLDVVGSERADPGEPAQQVPVRHDGRTVAVLTRESGLDTARMPSTLELTYLTTAGELLQMVGEGRLPFPGAVPDPESAPRVGDGLIRLDRTGHVVYASPNALSAYRRLGVSGDLLGAHLGRTIARLSAAPGRLDEPRGSAALAAALRFGEPRESEVEAQGATVLLRALPLLPGGQRRGALVLVRDVTELRSRERQLLGKDATIREIHHRVKNNLQTVAALLRMQARRVDEPAAKSALEESVRRVAAIATVHETLSQGFDEAVAFDAIADQVLAMSADVSARAALELHRDGTFGSLPAQVATAMALVLSELVQNAAEHGYPDGRAGRVRVQVQRGNNLAVEVTDDGVGLPAGFDIAASPALGLRIARTLVEGELRGTLTLAPRAAGGTCARVRLPLDGSPDSP